MFYVLQQSPEFRELKRPTGWKRYGAGRALRLTGTAGVWTPRHHGRRRCRRWGVGEAPEGAPPSE
eukprot:1336470-Pyramimonas_sp.AAC.1